MTLSSQLIKIKQNWLLILIVLILVLALNSFSITNVSKSFSGDDGFAVESVAMARGVPTFLDSFAPEVEDRSITKTSSITSEIKRGTFFRVDSEVKGLVEENEALILNENKNTHKDDYITSTYQIKVPTTNYDTLIANLKDIGKITSFNENLDDITKQKTNTQTSLTTEKDRLTRYKQILTEADTAQEKLEVTDRIFNLERTIRYFEDSLKNLDERVSFSTIHLTIKEDSSYAKITFIKFSEIAKNFTSSINLLIKFFVILLPWIIIIYIGYWLYKRKH